MLLGPYDSRSAIRPAILQGTNRWDSVHLCQGDQLTHETKLSLWEKHLFVVGTSLPHLPHWNKLWLCPPGLSYNLPAGKAHVSEAQERDFGKPLQHGQYQGVQLCLGCLGKALVFLSLLACKCARDQT